MNDDEARAALNASEKLYYRIGEVSKLTGVKAHVLRYWETEFRWMAPPKSRSKQRLYRKRDIEFVWLLKRLLWDERYTIAGARQRIQDLGVDEALALLAPPLLAPPSEAPGAGSTGSDHDRRSAAGQFDADSPSQTDAASRASQSTGRGRPSRAAGKKSKSETVAASGEPSPDWIAFGAALGDLHSELSTLRGALQEGL